MRSSASGADGSIGRYRQTKRKRKTKSSYCTNRREKLRIERLEERHLLTVAPVGDENLFLLSGHGGVCSCPICTGEALDQIPPAEIDTSGTSQAPLSSLPQLHSNAGATAKLFLDFDGHVETSWGFYSNITTPVFSQDSDLTTFSSGELSAIYEVWARVAEDFAPFNVDVTTVDPGTQANGVVAVIAIGGSYSDWYGSSAGGVAYIGGFYNAASNVGYVFENNLSSNTKNIAEASSHEAGHLFGLSHQATWSGSTLVTEYNTGNGAWAPIMGSGYNDLRTTWHNGPTNAGPTDYQDNMAVLAGASNGFGYKSDDYGGTTGTAGTLPASGTSVNFSGLIGLANDVDVWSFTTTGGSVTFQLTGAEYGSNLDAVLELWNSSGGTILSDLPSGSLGASLTTSLGAGTYYLVARGLGDYGDVGQYTITGSLPGASTSPEIDLSVSGVAIVDGGTLDFGTTTAGTAVTRTVTIANQGGTVLTLTPLNAGTLPTGFTLVSNLGATSLNAGASTTFVVRLDAAALGSFSGVIQLANDDSNENPYDLTLSGTVTAPEIEIAISGVGVADQQTVNFGSTTVGQSVSRTFTVTNTGTATLTLTSLNSGALPSGFTLTSNLGSTSLAAGQSTTFSVRLDATVSGSYGGTIQLVNNDGDENPYDIVLTGAVSAPEIDIAITGVGVADGQTANFGSTTVGQSVSRTFTVTNTGSATLSLTALNAGALPGGFTLISNLGSTSLAAGQSTTFSIRLDATSTGSYGGTIQLLSNDSDENPYDIVLTGTVTAPEIEIALSGVGVADGQTVNFGSASQGQSVSRMFTVTNTGTATLTLTALNSGALPAGFTLTSNLGSTSLAAGQSTTFTIRLDATAAGSYGGTIQLINGDSDENPYDIVLTGSVTAPEIAISVAGTNFSSGQSVAFGTTTQGQAISRTFTVTNTGNGTLSLTSLNAGSLPAGFTLTSNLSSTTLAAGQSATFTIQLNAAAAGTFGGTIQLANNDADENPFSLVVFGTVQAPEIKVTLAGTDVTSGQLIHFGDAVIGTTISRTFTVVNEGTSTLVLTVIDPTSLPPSFVLVSNLAVTTLAAGQSTSFTIEFSATTAGSLGGTIAVANSDADENPFVLQLQATASEAVPAKSTVLVAGQELSSGATVNFGTTVTGYTLERTFWIRNDGGSVLTLTPLDPSSLPAGFSLLQGLTSTSLAPGEKAWLILRLEAQSAGSYGGQVTLTTSDENGPFTVQVSGTVADPIQPLSRAIDNGDAGSSLVGSWTRSTGKGYASDIHTANKGQGSTTYSWNFGSLPAGEYQVFATYTGASSNASNAPFTVLDGSTKLTTVAVNQRTAPSGNPFGGKNWRLLATVTVNSGQLTVKLSNAANGKVVADAIRIERVVPVAAPSAEISVRDGGSDLTSGGSTVNFGVLDLGAPQTRTFTVVNQGTASLSLTPLDPASLPAGFSLVQGLGSTFLTPGESTTFVLSLDANAAGTFSGAVTLANNDGNESAFSFQVTGTVFDPSASLTQVIDDGWAGYSRTGTWTRDATKGYSNDQWKASAGTGSVKSTWNFCNLPNGQYRVQASWRGEATNATNSPFLLYNGYQLVSTVRVSERVTPNDVWIGSWWKNLGTVTVTGNQLMVMLTNAANGSVVADAIRIEKILPTGAALSASALLNTVAYESAPNTWMTSMIASQHRPVLSHSSTATPTNLAEAPHVVVSSVWQQVSDIPTNEPEDQLLADMLDLLAEARHAGINQPQDGLLLQELALTSLLQNPT